MVSRVLGPSLACLVALGCAATAPPSTSTAVTPEPPPAGVPDPAPVDAPAPPAAAPSIPPETPPPALGLPADLPRCDAEPMEYAVCRISGTYALGTFMGMKGGVMDVWPVLILADGSTWMLGSLWFTEQRPAPDYIERFEGKLVEVVGELHAAPPKAEGVRNLSITTISPIHAMRVLGDAP